MARSIAALLVAALLAGPVGCSECRNADDCPEGHACINGECRPLGGQDADAGADADADGADGLDGGDPLPEVDVPLDLPADDGTAGDAPEDGEEEAPPCTSDEECADSNPCTDDSCNMSFHVCMNVPRDGRDCDDGDPCNGVGVCDSAGTCVVDSAPMCEDGNPCTFDTCVGSGPECTHDTTSLDGTSCDNTLACDGADSCSGGACEATSPDFSACDDGDLCTLDVCSEGSSGAVCSHPSVTFRAVACGGRVTGITSGSSDASSYGSCSGTMGGGPEEVVVFAHTADTTVTFTLSDTPTPSSANNELYVLTDGCDPSTCTQVGATSVTVTVTAGTRVYVSVESVSGGAYFAVEASCS